MEELATPGKFQSLAEAVKSLDVALKKHLETMTRWYVSQNLFVDSLIPASTEMPQLPDDQQQQQQQQQKADHEHSKSSPNANQQQQGGNTNNNNLSGDVLSLSAQLGGRIRTRRNTRIPVAFDEAVIAKLRRPSANKTTVVIRVVFMKIGIIDTIHDRYSAEVLVQSKWRENSFDHKNQSGDAIDWDLHWNPRLSVENVIGEPKVSVSCAVVHDRDGSATVVERRRINGQFFEFMELNEFPFDRQDLTVTVVSEQDTDRVELVLDQTEKCGINSQAFSAEQEWSLEQKVTTWKRTIPRTINKMVVEYPALSVAAKASRRPQFFIWNIIIIMMAICSLAFATFTVNLETPQFRLQLTYILLLTTVTFKFVVNKSLPKISYLTYLDKYILGSMVILCGICVWHALVGSIIYSNLPKSGQASSNKRGNETTSIPNNSSDCSAQTSSSPGPECLLVDTIALAVLSFTYVSFHLFFLILIIRSRRAEDEESEEGADDQVVVRNAGDESAARSSIQQNGVQISVDPATNASSLT